MTPGHIHPITKSLEPLSDNFRLQMWRIRTAIYAGQDAPSLFQRKRWFWQRPPAARPRAATLQCAGFNSLMEGKE